MQNTPSMDWTSKKLIKIEWFDGREKNPQMRFEHYYNSTDEAYLFARKVLSTEGFGYVTITFESGDVERLNAGE